MAYENTDIQQVIRLACLKYLGNPAGLQNASVNDLIVKALKAYLNA